MLPGEGFVDEERLDYPRKDESCLHAPGEEEEHLGMRAHKERQGEASCV